MVPIGKHCVAAHCNSLAQVGDYCGMHYKRVQRHKDAEHRRNAHVPDYKNASKHPLYAVWRSCSRSAAGVYLCGRWKHFDKFVEDVGSRPEGKHYFRRIRADGLFEPGNVVWVPLKSDPSVAEKMRAYVKRRVELDPDYSRDTKLKKLYGISLGWYNRQYEIQNGICMICKKPELSVARGKTRRLAVDHDHSTGKVRGLLCHSCNTALGHFQNSSEILKSAISYLERN